MYVAMFEWDGFCLCWAGLKKIRSFSTETEKKKKLSTIRGKTGTTKLVGSSRISARSKTFSPNSTPSSPALATSPSAPLFPSSYRHVLSRPPPVTELCSRFRDSSELWWADAKDLILNLGFY